MFLLPFYLYCNACLKGRSGMKFNRNFKIKNIEYYRMLYLFQIKMELTFSGSESFLNKSDMLCQIVGRGSWFSQIRPVRFENLSTFHKLLFLFSAADYAAS